MIFWSCNSATCSCSALCLIWAETGCRVQLRMLGSILESNHLLPSWMSSVTPHDFNRTTLCAETNTSCLSSLMEGVIKKTMSLISSHESGGSLHSEDSHLLIYSKFPAADGGSDSRTLWPSQRWRTNVWELDVEVLFHTWLQHIQSAAQSRLFLFFCSQSANIKILYCFPPEEAICCHSLLLSVKITSNRAEERIHHMKLSFHPGLLRSRQSAEALTGNCRNDETQVQGTSHHIQEQKVKPPFKQWVVQLKASNWSSSRRRPLALKKTLKEGGRCPPAA